MPWQRERVRATISLSFFFFFFLINPRWCWFRNSHWTHANTFCNNVNICTLPGCKSDSRCCNGCINLETAAQKHRMYYTTYWKSYRWGGHTLFFRFWNTCVPGLPLKCKKTSECIAFTFTKKITWIILMTSLVHKLRKKLCVGFCPTTWFILLSLVLNMGSMNHSVGWTVSLCPGATMVRDIQPHTNRAVTNLTHKHPIQFLK